MPDDDPLPSQEVIAAVGALFGVADAVRVLQTTSPLVAEEAELLADRLIEVAEQLSDDEGVDPQRTVPLRAAFGQRTTTILSSVSGARVT